MASQTTLSTDPSVPLAILLTLAWGANFNKKAFYTSTPGSIALPDGTFLGLPEMDISIGKMTGGMEDDPTDIILPTVPPVDELFAAVAHSPITATVEEMDLRDPTTRRILTFGLHSQTILNVDGDPTHAKLTFEGLKAQLKVQLGIECGNTCPWVFGGYGCQKPLPPLTFIGIAANASTRFLQVNGLPSYASQIYRRGFVACDGLSLMIRNQPAGNIMELSMPAPEYWRGRPVTVQRGCNNTIADCTRNNNIVNFGGAGLKMLTVNPLYQTI